MPSPDRPHPHHPEGEIKQPREGLKMALRFTDLSREPFLPAEQRSEESRYRISLELEGLDGKPTVVHSRSYEPRKELQHNYNLTIAEYLQMGDFSSAAMRYQNTLSNLAMEAQWQRPDKRRSTIIDKAKMREEALYPEKFEAEEENIHQVLLIEGKPPLSSFDRKG